MTLLEQQLRDMPDDELTALVVHLDAVHRAGKAVARLSAPTRAAAHAELSSRPRLERAVFPAHPTPTTPPGLPGHGTGCSWPGGPPVAVIFTS